MEEKTLKDINNYVDGLGVLFTEKHFPIYIKVENKIIPVNKISLLVCNKDSEIEDRSYLLNKSEKHILVLSN